MIEVDVQRTLDGELVIFHDWDLVRLAGDRSVVESASAIELRGRHPMMTVAELLEVVPSSMPLNIELKRRRADRNDFARSILEVLSGRNGVVLSGFDWPLLEEVRRLDARMPLAPLGESADGLAEIADELNAYSVNCHRSHADRGLVEASAPRPVFVYTVNRAAEARKLLEIGVSGFFTDYPARLRSQLG